jgi:hypothetical protein
LATTPILGVGKLTEENPCVGFEVLRAETMKSVANPCSYKQLRPWTKFIEGNFIMQIDVSQRHNVTIGRIHSQTTRYDQRKYELLFYYRKLII